MEHEKSTRFPDARQEGAGTAGSEITLDEVERIARRMKELRREGKLGFPFAKVLDGVFVCPVPQPPGREPEGRG